MTTTLATVRGRRTSSHPDLRTVLGLLGILLPFVLVLGEWLLLDGHARARGSMSAYYHSGMRDVFVGVLVTEGLFLLTYRVPGQPVQNAVTNVAGVAAVLVATFPTGLPPICAEPGHAGDAVCGAGRTPLQEALGMGHVSFVHGISAVVLFSLLALMSWFFGLRATGPQQALHRACAISIAVAIVAVFLCKVTGSFETWATYVGELVMSVAFGVSWLAAGRAGAATGEGSAAG